MSKKILMVVARKNFRDEEYFIPRSVFLKSGFEVTTASSVSGKVLGLLGGEGFADIKIDDANVDDFDAMIFSGGAGAQEYFENKRVLGFIQEFHSRDKIIGAICIAPVILAKSGILRGKKATVWTSPLDKVGRNIIEQNGCVFSESELEVDGKIVTANGPQVAEKFAVKIVSMLS